MIRTKRHPKGEIKKQDDYHMHWLMEWESAHLQAPDGAICRNGHPLKLIVAKYWYIAPDFPSSGLRYARMHIVGNDGVVEEVVWDLGGESPLVELEVTIQADPPLRVPFVRRYELSVAPDSDTVSVREI